MSFKKLEAQNIEDLVIEKKKDQNSAIISMLGETCELNFYREVFTFRMHIVDIHEMDTDMITKISRCLKIMSGALLQVHNQLLIIDDTIYTILILETDDIYNVKIHERIIDYFGIAHYLKQVFKGIF